MVNVSVVVTVVLVPCAKDKGFENNMARTKSETIEVDSISFMRFSTKVGLSP